MELVALADEAPGADSSAGPDNGNVSLPNELIALGLGLDDEDDHLGLGMGMDNPPLGPGMGKDDFTN